MRVHDLILTKRFQDVADPLDAGSGPGEIWYYPDPVADSLADVPSFPPLARQVLESPCAIASPTDLVFLSPAMPAQVEHAGFATWARFVDSDGNAWIDAPVAEDDGTGTQVEEVLVSNAQMFPGAFVELVSAVFTES